MVHGSRHKRPPGRRPDHHGSNAVVRDREIAVTDTHALIWWIKDAGRRLGRKADAFFHRVDEGSAVVCIPAVCLVELSEAIQAGEVLLGEPFADFVTRLETTPSRFSIVPVTPDIARRSHELFGIPERGDRLIAATAAVLRYPLITRDPEIVAAIAGEHIW